MSVLDREALEASPLADLHALASELSIDSYRLLRRPELIEAILARQSGEQPDAPAAETAAPRRRRGRRGGRGRASEPDGEADEDEASPAEKASAKDKTPAKDKTSRGGRAPRGKASPKDEAPDEPAAPAESPAPAEETAAPADENAEGVVELLPNGSGFVRVNPPDPSDDDVYISAAQVRRCELVSGDRVSGPRRAPRRSERFASLVRIDTVNDRPADEIAEGTRFDDLPCAFPADRLPLGTGDPTTQAIDSLAPLGLGSRVTIVGASGSGKTEALRRIAASLAGRDELQLSLALAGVRPEEVAEWALTLAPSAAASLAASSEASAHAVELVVDQARRLAVRGANAVVLIDTLDGLQQPVAWRALAAARNLVDGGSLTVIATASRPVGGETTVIALDRDRAQVGHYPALDAGATATMRPELLVGDDAAQAIHQARAEAIQAQ